MVLVQHPIIYVLGLLLIAGRLQALGVILHDACHLPPRRRTIAFIIIEALAGWPIGSTISAMRYHHLRHHRAVCTPEDPYLHHHAARGGWIKRVMMLRGALLPVWWPLRTLMAPLALVWPAFRPWYARGFLQERSKRDLRQHPEVIACARADLSHCIAYLLVITAIVHWQLPFFTYYGLPWILAGIMNANRVLIEHDHVENGERSQQAVWAMTHTCHYGWLGKLVLFPRNIGFHQVHHVYPALALEHLPAVHRHILSRLEISSPKT